MISIRELDFYYKSKEQVLDHISLNIHTGIYGLLGENGVGKTTLLHLIAGLLFPKSGLIFLQAGKNIYEPCYRMPEAMRLLAFLPTDFRMPSTSIASFARYHSPYYPDFSEEVLELNLKEFGLEPSQKLSRLSYGQQRKAMLAYLLSLNTPITLLDEPTNGLDISSRLALKRMLARTASDDKCLIISTHQVSDFENLFDHLVILGENRVLLDSSVEEITSRLLFARTDALPAQALYSHQTVRGYASVVENEIGEETTLELELLYKAVLQNPDRIRELFSKERRTTYV